MFNLRRWLLCVVVLGLPVASAFAWELPLTVEEYLGNGGQRHVSGGVPLLVGQAKEAAELRLAVKGADGSLKAVPAQFRVLARWWRADNSIRWVLVDFVTDVGPKEKKSFILTNARLDQPAPADTLVVDETDEAITVTTGPARFVIDRKHFAFLEHAFVDANGDGTFTPDEDVLATTPECGTVVEDAFGEKYYASESTRSVEVIERGPMRVRVRARGTHRARGGKGYSKGMYSYDYFMDFYAGATTVFVDLIMGNNPPKSVGTPTFEDASLIIKLNGGIGRYSIAGHRGTPHAGDLAKGTSVCLYQDSNGAATWNKCQGYNTEQRDYWRYPEGKTASFRGYKVWRRAGGQGAGEEVATGDQARGTVHVRTNRGGLVVHLRNFWQQFPKGVEVAADGTVRLALFPREYKVVHFLEDATAKGHEIVLHFYAKGKPGVYGAADDGAPDAATIARIWDSKVLPRPAQVEHICATGALADTGPFTVPTSGMTATPNNRTEAYGSRMLTTDGLYGNAYGWQVFGERWRSCGGHSSRAARQPMNQDNYLYRWFVTGVHGWFLNGDARSRQFRDVRAYRIEDQDPFGFKDWNHFRMNNRSEDWTHRPQPKDEEARKYAEGRYPRSTFWLPNPAHMVMDLIYDRYLLMGDQRSFENMRIIAAHGGYYAAYRSPVVHRATGWSWRALYRYWELTGDKDCERLLNVTVQNYKKMVDGEIKFPMARGAVNWWFTFVFSRAAAMTALHTGDPDALYVCKKMADAIAKRREEAPQGYYSGDFAELHAVLYHLTGEEKYKTLALGKDNGESLKRLTGGMKLPACAHWLLQQPVKAQ